MSGDIITICKERSGAIITKPQAITDKKEIVNLNDMALLLEVYQKLNTIDFGKLKKSFSAIGAIHEVATKYHGPKSALVLMVETLKVEKFEGEDKKVVDSLLAELKEVHEKYLRLFDEKNPVLSTKARTRYKEVERKQKGPLHQRSLEALKIVIGEIGYGLSIDAKKKLKIRGGDWIDKLSAEIIKQKKIDLLIWRRCKPGGGKKVEPKPEPKPEQKPEPKPRSKVKVDYSLRLGSGYGLNPIGKEHPELLAAQERGILMQSAGSLKLDIASKLYLQIDYNGSAPYDVQEGDNLVSNYDFGRISLAAGPSDNVDLLGQVGWLYYRNDYPGKETPDINALVEGLRVNWRPLPGLSLNLDQSLLAGWTNQSFPKETSDFHLIRAMGEAGASYQVGPFIPFIGGIGGYGEDGEIYGGYIGTGLNIGEYEANLRAQYINDEGLSAGIRCFYNQEDWGIGAQAFYQNYDFENEHRVGGGVVARFTIAEFWGNVLELQPFANAAYAMDPDSALNVNFGVMLRFGGLRPAQPSSLRPYSIVPLPEAK